MPTVLDREDYHQKNYVDSKLNAFFVFVAQMEGQLYY